MRKIILFFLIVLCCNCNSFAQWQWLNPTPSGYVNTKLAFINNDSGFLFNQGGDLFKTADRGTNWQLVQNFPNANVMDLAFSTGIIAGLNNTIYISSDNGQTWEFKNPVWLGNIKKAEIISRDTIFIMTDSSKLYKTNNKGNTWNPLNFPNVPIRSIDFVNSKLGFLSNNAGIYRTSDGGNNWQQVYTVNSTAWVITVKFYNSLIGFAYREGSEMLKTSDGGNTWTSSYVGHNMYDIFFVNQNNAYTVGELGEMYHTVNGGNAWTRLPMPLRGYAGDLYSQYFFNDSTGLVVGHRGIIMKTINSGLSWQKYSPTYIDVRDISFGTNNTGYFTTSNNIYRTTDKGQTWNELPFYADTIYPFNEHFEQCHFFNADTGLLFRQGWSSSPIHIYKTYDGGQTWQLSTSFPFLYFTNGISFINNTTGYANFSDLSSSPSIYFGLYKTTDAGTSWQLINNTQKLLKIRFLNEQIGFATWYKKLYKTLNGGNTWQEILENSNGDVEDVYFINANKGFAIDNSGYLKMTLDGGLTWTSVEPNSFYDHFIAIKFFDDKAGYLTTITGSIYKTVDGGFTWNKYKNAPYYENRAITFTADSTVYIGGMYGTILSNKIAEYSIDSLNADPVTSCSATLSAKIRADFSRVDSVWFQYGITDFTNTVVGNPSNVSNNKIISTVQATNLTQSSNYKFRVKFLYKGVYKYSDIFHFKTLSLLTPIITDSIQFLQSSAFSGNQWFLNGQEIAGAVSQRFTPVVSGIYKVQLNVNGCLSQFSNEINFIYAGDSSLPKQTTIFPNPANNLFYIKNAGLRNLEITIVDVYGRLILLTKSKIGLITIPLNNLQSGYYFVIIRDDVSKEKLTNKIIKL